MSAQFEEFLKRNRISPEQFEESGCDWSTLQAIGADHEKNAHLLKQSAANNANAIQALTGVHSVRWRVKDPEHLLEKIVRRRLEGQEKYATLTPDNYYSVVSDLVGIRALHLFKEDCFAILPGLHELWTPIETPVAYIREGDPDELTKRYQEQGLEVKVHEKGYRSIHYVCSAKPFNRDVIAEIQVRTIFEEGWSEIDHKIRYPNFSDDQLIGYFLAIFNRLAGNADEMGSFVRGLSQEISQYRGALTTAESEKAEIYQAMQKALNELEASKQEHKGKDRSINELRTQIKKLEKYRNQADPFGNALAELARTREERERKYKEDLAKKFGPGTNKLAKIFLEFSDDDKKSE